MRLVILPDRTGSSCPKVSRSSEIAACLLSRGPAKAKEANRTEAGPRRARSFERDMICVGLSVRGEALGQS